VEVLLDKPMIQEVGRGIEILKNGKTPGIDEVVSECLKKEEEKLIQQLQKRFHSHGGCLYYARCIKKELK